MSLSKFTKESDLKLNIESFKNTNSTKSFRQRLINSITKEVELILVREDLTLRKITKNVNEKSTTVNEVRFWKNHPTDSTKVLVNIREKNRIFDFDNKPNTSTNREWFIVDNNKDSVVGLLNTIKSQLETMDDNNPLLQKPIVVKKDKKVESLNTTI